MARPPSHGMWNHYLYNTWNNMMQRCYDEKSKHYKNYGGRGITVSSDWHSVAQFISDMGERPEGHTLDRIDNNKGYSKENCKWSLPLAQVQNRRNSKSISFNGEIKTLKEWCSTFHKEYETVWMRLKRGWDIEKALTFPVSKSNGSLMRSRL